jgi:hypothetical protein
MATGRLLTLAIVAVVLGIAWYAGSDTLGMGIAVAIVGLSATYSRRVLGIPAAAVMAAAALYVPGVIAAAVLGFLLMAIGMTDSNVRLAVRIGP